jgi:hypothetical protein
MPNAGRTITTGNNVWVQNQGSNNEYGSLITMTETGLITFLDVYMACSGSTMDGVLCLWNSSGVLVGQSATFTVPAGSGGVNGQSWQRQALVTPYLAVAGTYYVGFWRQTSKTAEWSYKSGTGTIHPSAPSGGVSNVGSPGNLNLGSSTTGQMSAYVEYVVGGLDFASGGTFHKYAMKRYDSGSSTWKRHPLKRWNASANGGSGAWEWLA